MNPLQLVNYLWPAFISMMILSAVVASLPGVLANEPSVTTIEELKPLEESNGNWQDLQELEAKEDQQWSWDIQESDGIISENIEYEISPDLLNNTSIVDVEKEDQEWENSHRGDPINSGGKVPFVEF